VSGLPLACNAASLIEKAILACGWDEILRKYAIYLW
jgi:hypothetical protein